MRNHGTYEIGLLECLPLLNRSMTMKLTKERGLNNMSDHSQKKAFDFHGPCDFEKDLSFTYDQVSERPSKIAK